MSNSVVITNCIPQLIALLGLASEDDTRPAIMCARFEVSPTRCLAIATDGRRLGVLDCGCSLSGGDAFGINVEAKELAELIKAAHSLRPKTLAVRVSAESVVGEFDGGRVSVAARGVQYPDWRKVFDVTVDKPEFTQFNPAIIDGFSDCDPQGLVATTFGDARQILIHGVSGRFFGVCMPVNREGKFTGLRVINHAVPAWIGGAS